MVHFYKAASNRLEDYLVHTCPHRKVASTGAHTHTHAHTQTGPMFCPQPLMQEAKIKPRNYTPSCSWDDEADCQKNVVCWMCQSMFAKFTCRPAHQLF